MPAKRKNGVLTRSQIISESVITAGTYNEQCLQSASYSLRLGDDYYRPQPIPSNGRKQKVTEDDISHCSDDNNVLKIPRYSSVVFSSEEVLNIPDNVVGRFDLRPKYAMQGLVLQVGAQVEPAYKGRLFGLLLNFSSADILVPKGEKLLSIEFSYLYDTVAITEKDKREYNTLFSFIGKKATPVQGALEEFQKEMEERLKLMGSAKTERLRRTVTNIIGGAGILIAILIPLIILYFTKATYDRGSFPSEIIEELRENNELLHQENEILKRNFLDIEAKIDSLVIRNAEAINTEK